MVLAVAVGACAGDDSAEQTLTQVAPTSIVIPSDDAVATTSGPRDPVSVPPSVTTTEPVTETTATTIEASTTTTSAPEQPPTEVRQGSDDCTGSQTLRVRVEGSDGLPVTSQISADYKKSGQKVDANGDPIPNDQYSQTTFINSETGTRDVCFPAVPNAEVYLEVYPKDYVGGEYTHRSKRYGSVMWHGVWAGPGQGVVLRVPVACGPQQAKGKTGTINVKATVDDHEVSLRRLVAWSRTEGSMKLTPGFAVADREQYGTPEVKRIETVAAGQQYFVQVQTTDDKVITVEPVPVEACHETNLEVHATKTGCSVTIDDGEPKDCKILKKPVG